MRVEVVEDHPNQITLARKCQTRMADFGDDSTGHLDLYLSKAPTPGRKCLYCETTLLTDKPSKAHIVPEGIGGTLWSPDIECADCNPGLSRVEYLLAQDYLPISGPLGLVRGDGDPGAPHRIEVQGERFRFYGGLLQPMSPRGPERKLPDGRVEIVGRGQTADDMARVIVHRLREKKMTPDEWERANPGGLRIWFSRGRKGNAGEFTLRVGGEHQERAVTKMTLGLLAFHAPDLARRPELRHARAFVRQGGREFGDPLDIGPDIAAREGVLVRDEALPPFAHVVEIWTVANALLGRVLLFGHFPFSMRLIGPWSGEPFSTSYVVDPTTGKPVGRSERGRLIVSAPSWWSNRRRISTEQLEGLTADALRAMNEHWKTTIEARKEAIAAEVEEFTAEDVMRRATELYAELEEQDSRRS